MLQTLRLRPTKVGQKSALPPFLCQIAMAAEHGANLVPHIESLTRQWGFDSFAYQVVTKFNPEEENRIFEISTLPPLWAIRYDQYAYVEVDHRVRNAWDSSVPLIWDQASSRTGDSRLNAFLDDALEHGLASGVSFPLVDETATKIVVDFVARAPAVDSRQRNTIRWSLGDMFLFAKWFHELFRGAVIEKKIPARNVGMPLSARERRCLELAADGATIEAIAETLRIDHRLVQVHFNSIRSKLEVIHLRDAIATFAGGRS